MNINFRYLISVLLLVSVYTVAKAQPSYTHPTTGLQNTYTGTCMVNVCSAVYYDDGGGFANYSDNINGVLRTFCPDNPGQAVQVYFNYFNIEGGSGCPYDFFQVINGPTQNGTVIASGCGTDLQGQTYTSTHPSGCLTFRFWSDNSVNLPGWVSILTCVPHPNGFSNGPQAGTNADCAFATGICSNSYNFTGLSTGPGLTSDGCGGCVLAENHSNWYEFTISTSGTLGFTIVPNNPSVDDYDFALYQASNCSSLGSPVRCSYAATTGNTGLQTGAGDFTEDVLGNGWVETISVTAGQKFYLLINEWSPNNSGFTLNWTGTATIATPKPTFIINSTSYPDGGSYSVCQNQPLTITADGAGGSTFTWWNQATGGTQIGTGATYSPSTSTPGSVTYYLQEHTASGCISARSAITINVQPTNTVSGPGSATVCVNTAMTPINHTTTGATGIGAPSGLPPGVTASFSSGTITISGTPTATGTFNYSIPLTGGCGSVNATGTINVTTPNTVTGPGSATVCVNTAMTNITHSTTGATGIGAPSGLPPGVTASFSSGTITISGTPTASGTYNYSIPLTGGCGSVNATGTITVNPNNTVSGPGSRTVCINTSMTPITHTTTGATGIGSPTGLPPGITASFSSGTITISGTPTASGTYNYSIPLTGGCGSANATGTITVNPNNTVSGPGSATVCINTAMTPINHTTTGATGIGAPSGLPAGVTASFSSGTITISGTPTAVGSFNYTIPLTGGCGSVNATGTITVVNTNTVSGPGSGTACVNIAMTPIIHNTAGATGIGSPTGLPSGVTASFSGSTITISGTPTSTGSFNYSIPLTGGCGSVNATGTITVNPINTVSGPESATVCVNTAMPTITHTTTGATGIGSPVNLPPGVTASFSGGTITISGTPTASGTYNYSIPLTGGCGSVNATGTINVNGLPTVSANASPGNTACEGSEITLSGSGAQSYTWTGGVTDGVPFNQPPSTVTYTVTGTDANGCTNTSSISITVYPNPTVGINALPSNTVCSGQSLTLNGTGSGTTYSWSGGITDGTPFTPTASDVYTVTATDGNGCTNTTSISVVVNPLPSVTASSNSPVCSGSDIQLNATSASGTSCLWSGPNAFISALFNEIIPLANELLHEGNYTVVVTDLNTSCTNSQTIFVDVVDQISSTIDPVAPICQNEGTIQLTAANSGGTWSGNGVNSSGIFNPMVAGPGTHTITYTISGNCGSSSTEDIIVLEAPTATPTYNNPVCENDELILQGNLPSPSVSYSVQWTGPNNYNSSQATNTISPATTSLNGVYWYYIQYANGCQDSSSINVTVTPMPVIANATVTDESCYNSNNGSIDLSITSSASYDVTWSNGASTDDIGNLNAGTYTVTVSVNGVCTASGTYVVNSPEPIDLYLKDVTQPNCGTNNGRINLGVTGGITPFTFTWQPNVSTDSVANQLSEGQYYIMLTDDNGCSDTLTVNLICVPDSMIIPQLVTPNNDGKNDVWEVDLSDYPNNVVKIFNRWGNLVFAANPYLTSNYWDGKVGQNVMLSLGNDYLPVGTYYYVIDLFGDGSKIYKGYIELQY